MFEDALCNGKGTVFADSRALFCELAPGPLGGLRNMGYTGLEQNTDHCDWCGQTFKRYPSV